MDSRITHVAIRHKGKVYSLPAPNRHHHILWMIAKEKGLPDVPEVVDADKLAVKPEADVEGCGKKVRRKGEEQGFLDDSGRYLTRDGALEIVKLNGQLKNGRVIGGPLTSEDLW